MTTGLQLALLGGALVGLGLSLIVWRLLPADPDPVDVVHRYSPEGVRARTAAAGPTLQASTTPDRLGIWAIKRFPRPGGARLPPRSWPCCGSRCTASTARRSSTDSPAC